MLGTECTDIKCNNQRCANHWNNVHGHSGERLDFCALYPPNDLQLEFSSFAFNACMLICGSYKEKKNGSKTTKK